MKTIIIQTNIIAIGINNNFKYLRESGFGLDKFNQVRGWE